MWFWYRFVAVLVCGRFGCTPSGLFCVWPVEHSNSRFDSICYANRFESIRFVKKRPFDSLVVMQFFLLIYCIVSAKKYTTMHAQLKAILCRTSTKNSYAMHTMKILLTYYLNVSVQAANLSDCRIESKLFFARIGMLYCQAA